MRIRQGVRTIETLKLDAYVSNADIVDGECRSANRCMAKLAVERKLRVLEPSEPNHHTRVDAGHIRFNFRGYRYLADTPRIVAHNLKMFDAEEKQKRKADRQGVPFESKVKPFQFKIVAERKSKIVPIPRERQEEINQRRRERVATGTEKRQRYTLHKRVVGFA